MAVLEQRKDDEAICIVDADTLGCMSYHQHALELHVREGDTVRLTFSHTLLQVC